jgi:hypothetical protein
VAGTLWCVSMQAPLEHVYLFNICTDAMQSPYAAQQLAWEEEQRRRRAESTDKLVADTPVMVRHHPSFRLDLIRGDTPVLPCPDSPILPGSTDH